MDIRRIYCYCSAYPKYPCFLAGNTAPTLPHELWRLAKPALGLKADTAPDDGKGSRLYQVSTWAWRFGRGQARTQTVAEAVPARTAVLATRAQDSAATRKRLRAERGAQRQ